MSGEEKMHLLQAILRYRSSVALNSKAVSAQQFG